MSRVDSTFRDIELMVSEMQSPHERSARLASFAAEQIEAVRASNASTTGRSFPPEVYVDGRLGAPLTGVRPDGVIVAEFDLIREALKWIGEQLLRESPRLTGRYMQSHVMFVDGAEQPLGQPIKEGEEYAFLNTQPYTRKIERGLSEQAPEGVYEAIAAVASRRFGNVARIRFSFRSLTGGKATEDRAASDYREALLMAHPTVVTVVEARLATGFTSAPIVEENSIVTAPADRPEYLQIQFPYCNAEQAAIGSPGGNWYREEGAFRVVATLRRGEGADKGRQWLEQIASLFREAAFEGVQCYAPTSPVSDDRNEGGGYYRLSIAVPYEFQFQHVA